MKIKRKINYNTYTYTGIAWIDHSIARQWQDYIVDAVFVCILITQHLDANLNDRVRERERVREQERKRECVWVSEWEKICKEIRGEWVTFLPVFCIHSFPSFFHSASLSASLFLSLSIYLSTYLPTYLSIAVPLSLSPRLSLYLSPLQPLFAFTSFSSPSQAMTPSSSAAPLLLRTKSPGTGCGLQMHISDCTCIQLHI